ncbi:MAG: glycosyltransferase [Chloroflexota bacterium]
MPDEQNYSKQRRPNRETQSGSQRNNPQTPQHSGKPYPRPERTHPLNIVSVVIPLFNEEESLPELALQLEDVLSKHANNRYEVIMVDDGSTDGSFDVIKQIHARNNKFRGIRFRRNYGKSAALAVGFAAAKGQYVVTMDADLQDDPQEVPNLINKLKEGYDLVSGWKQNRKDPLSKTAPSKLFNYITSVASGLKLHDFNCGLKAYRYEVVKSLRVYGEMHRFLPALAHRDGFKVTELPVKHYARRFGKSKFGLSRFINGFLDLLTVVFTTKYLKKPLHFFGSIGMLLVILGFLIDGWLTIEWAAGLTSLSNRPLALLGVALIIVGVQITSLGLLGEMIIKNSPENLQTYSIKERV